MASWFVGSTPDRAVQVQALTRDIKLGSQERHSTCAACTDKMPQSVMEIINMNKSTITIIRIGLPLISVSISWAQPAW